jgi:hypothetical protein
MRAVALIDGTAGALLLNSNFPHRMSESKDIRALQLVLVVYVVIFGAKLAVYFLSGVMVLLAEALHTLSDIFISGFLLVAALASPPCVIACAPGRLDPSVNVGGVLVLVRAVLWIVTVSGGGRRIPELLDVVDVGHVGLDVLAAGRDVVHRELPAGHRMVEGLPDLVLVLGAHPREDVVDVSRIERLARERDDRPVERVAVADCPREEQTAVKARQEALDPEMVSDGTLRNDCDECQSEHYEGVGESQRVHRRILHDVYGI